MKQITLLFLCGLWFSLGASTEVSAELSAQKREKFDIVSFQIPKGWKQETGKNAVQIGTANDDSGESCLITMFKSLPGTGNSKVNFASAWEAIVKEAVSVSGKPKMQPSVAKNGWMAESGAAPYESDGRKGVVLLVTLSGQNKMLNILILTNTNSYQQGIANFLESVDLPKIKAAPQSTSIKPVVIAAAARKSGFKFSTSNFDDGWISTEQENWVSVVRGNTKVLIHYPNPLTDKYNSVLLDSLKNAWDVLVAPRYSSSSNMQFRPITGWQSIEFAEAEMVEKASGKTVYVVLFKIHYSNGSGKYLEFITPSKRAFEAEFGAYKEETSGWEKMEKMATYNKFAVAPSDLKGTWTNKYSGMIQYANIYTGADAGAATSASAEKFVFGVGNSYKWDIGVASGTVGNIKFQSAKSSGKFVVPNNWQVKFSSIEGKPRTFRASFAAVKGARILWLDDTAFGKVK